MHITGEMKMVDVVQKDIQLLAVIQRLRIPLGFREKSVKEVCLDRGVDLQFFLSLANAFHDKDYFKVEYFRDFPVTWLIDYLKSAHKCYIDYRIPEIERQIINLEKQVDPNENNMELLLNFFREYIREFTLHIQQEEANVFPYIIELSERVSEIEQGKFDNLGEEPFSMQRYLEDHNNIEEKLFDLKNILLKYLPPPVENCEYNNLIYDIFRLESDLLDHADMEEGVLFPRVQEMENLLNNIIKNRG
ncbi:hemerythrin domain-containing protein [Carboxylicivirga caseinilyticus]|uniref:hemerythrin domain-containing protein n=1 Tax=Carboxylicivirga caseinilyticus TaxID=3417572 RepID=UPI003D325508|nr:hemerythrin domain-containing protein [Marinilabiliaceae bacterium A049]